MLIPATWDRGGRTRQIDWANPVTVLARTLELLKRFDCQYADDLKFSRNALAALSERLDGHQMSQLDKQRIETSMRFIDALQGDTRVANAFIGHVAALPKFSEALKKRLRAQQDAILKDATNEAVSLVQQARGEASAISMDAESRSRQLDEEIDQRRTKLTALEAKIAAAEEKLSQAVEQDSVTVQRALETRLLEIAERPHAWLADIAVLRAGLGPFSGRGATAQVSGTTRPHMRPMIRDCWRDHGVPIEDIKAIQRALRAVLGRRDVNRILAATLAGVVPFLSGVDSISAAVAFARTIAAGRVVQIGIAPGLTTPPQLFLDSEPGELIVPAAHGLLDALLYARDHPDELLVVILEGANRSAIDLYLLPILAVYGGARPWLPLYRPELAAHCEEFASLAALQWPANVLLIATEADETQELAALPVPPSVWGWAASVPVMPNTRADPDDAQVTEVTVAQWREWSECPGGAGSLVEALEEILDTLHDDFSVQVTRAATQRMLHSTALGSRFPGFGLNDVIALWLARPIVAFGLDAAREELEARDAWPTTAVPAAGSA